MKTVKTFQRHCTLLGLVEEKINKKLTKRIEKLSEAHNKKRQGSIAVFANEHIGIQINQYGIYDRLGLEILFHFLSPISSQLKNGLAMDIGANIGNHSLYFSDRFKEVQSFEPNPATFTLLAFNLRGVSNALPFNFGLGQESGHLELNENLQNMGESSIVYKTQGSTRTVKIELKVLDEISNGINDLIFMKIDVEGYEYSVLAGGLATIARHQPVIVMEQHASEFSDGSTDSIRLLSKLGYKFCWYQPASKGKSWFRRQSDMLLNSIFRSFQEYKIVTSEIIPVGKYGMLMAIPQRFHDSLGLSNREGGRLDA
jgi:FkbM family methyltransferase